MTNENIEINHKPTKTLMGQIGSVTLTHFLCVLIEFILGIMVLGATSKYPVMNVIATALMILIYVWVMFIRGYEMADYDHKPYHYIKGYPWKGIVLALGLNVLTVVFFVLFLTPWLSSFVNGDLKPLMMLIENVPFVLWTFPFNTILQISESGVSVLGAVIAVAVPELAAGIGYYMGYKKIDVGKGMSKFIYEKKKK